MMMTNKSKPANKFRAGKLSGGNEPILNKRRRTLSLAGFALCIMIVLIVLQYHLIEETSPLILALLNFNIIILLFLIFLILRNLIKLYVEHSRQQSGSRFRNKLILAFTTLTLMPSLLLLLVGSNLISSSIRNWFDPQVEQFLDDVMDVARLSLHLHESRCNQISRSILSILPEIQSSDLFRDFIVQDPSIAGRLLNEFQIDTIQIIDYRKTDIGRASQPDLPSGIFPDLSSPFIDRALSGKAGSMISNIGASDIIFYAFPVLVETDEKVGGVFIIGSRISGELSNRIWNIRDNYEKYMQQKQAIHPTQGLYLSVFIMISLTVLFASMWIALYFARQISHPIAHLSHATLEVAKGNYDYHLDIQAPDELGDLVRSFNSMMEELRTNRGIIEKTTLALHHRNREIETRRNELEVILSTIKSGVIALDVDGIIRVINAASCGFLTLIPKDVIDKTYIDAFRPPHLKALIDILERMYVDRYKVFQNEIQIESGSRLSTFSINVTPLYDGNGCFNGVVIVLNDLTQLLRIQRITAWREVAKRLAHEIKNPLTPIQLNTQRIQKKFREHSPDFPTVFEEATESIIEEVAGLRRMLNEFSQLAQMPETIMSLGRIDEIITQAAALYAGRQEIEMELILSPEVPLIMMDKSQIKRVFINLIDNAVHAMNGRGKVTIKTCYDRTFDKIRIEVMDCGPGVPSEEKNKLFTPYFSTKRDGSGLGLTICSRIITDHEGGIRVTDNEPHGARFIIDLPVVLSGRSTLPGAGAG